MAYKSYDVYETKMAPSKQLFAFEMEQVLDGIYRRISSKQTVLLPWGFAVERKCHRSLFYDWLYAVRDHTTKFGFRISQKRDAKGKLKSSTITFDHYGAMLFHLGKVVNANLELKTYLSKSLKHGCRGKVVVNDEKFFTIVYNDRRSILKVNGFFKVTNSYGHVISD